METRPKSDCKTGKFSKMLSGKYPMDAVKCNISLENKFACKLHGYIVYFFFKM